MPKIKNVATAPMVYFDAIPTFGVMGEVVEIDLAARVLVAYAEGDVRGEAVCVAHLRCNANAAASLMQTIDKALKMKQQLQAPKKDDFDDYVEDRALRPN